VLVIVAASLTPPPSSSEAEDIGHVAVHHCLECRECSS
jgi:hypothetical protein